MFAHSWLETSQEGAVYQHLSEMDVDWQESQEVTQRSENRLVALTGANFAQNGHRLGNGLWTRLADGLRQKFFRSAKLTFLKKAKIKN